ncbi:hypothetical protein ACLB2K_019568 [Fragaria x ananassa]
MSQEQQHRPPQGDQLEPIKYGDVFNVSGELASKPIAPRDAATMQAAENIVLGETQKGGPAEVMQSAATYNERAGLVGQRGATVADREEGVTISESIDLDGCGTMSQYVEPPEPGASSAAVVLEHDAITIGEALEATALSAGDKPIDQSDAAAIQAAEMRATGSSEISLGGLAAIAQYAVSTNAREADKTKLADGLEDATQKMGADKAVTCEDAKAIIGAEIRNNPDMSTTPTTRK